jgi:hypothetical protein
MKWMGMVEVSHKRSAPSPTMSRLKAAAIVRLSADDGVPLKADTTGIKGRVHVRITP